MQTVAERFDTSTASRAKFEPHAVLLQDSGSWPGLRIEHWQGSGEGELAETVLFQHGLMLNLDVLRSAEIRWQGHRSFTGDFAAGTLGIYPAGIPYSGHARGTWQGLIVGLDPKFMQSAIGRWNSGAIELVPGFGLTDGFILHACQALADDVRGQYPCGMMYGESIAVALAAHLAKFHGSDPRVHSERLSPSDRRRARIREFVLDRLDQRISLAEMAAFAQLDLYSFAKWFKSAFGVPPHQYVLKARVEQARSLLSSSTLSLVDVALQCGFSSQSHLSSTFRRFVGVAPKVYRGCTSQR